MFILHFLPDSLLAFIVDAVFLLGLLATVLTCFLLKHLVRFTPWLAPHVKIAQIASIVVLLSGVYFEGGYSAEKAWRQRVAEVEAQVAAAEAEARAANDKLNERGQDKVREIRGKTLVVRQYIDREITKYDATCPIPKEVVKAHNAAAKNEVLK
jgi:hypothetical protein